MKNILEPIGGRCLGCGLLTQVTEGGMVAESCLF